MGQLLLVGLLAYLVGSLPNGVVVVRAFSGRDVRQSHSGRTGGTNALRTAGLMAGVLTGLGDLFKGIVGVWLARWLLAGSVLLPWGEAVGGAAAVAGHVWSLFLISRETDASGVRRWKVGGGAGGITSAGVAIALWPWNLPLMVAVLLIGLVGIGYASVTTLGMGISALVVFTALAVGFGSPLAYVVYALAALTVQVITLQPNLRRLMRGEERMVGPRARRRAKRLAEQAQTENETIDDYSGIS